MPSYETGLWFGLMAPAGTPRDIVEKLAKAVPEAMDASEAATALRTQGLERLAGGPDTFARYIVTETAKWDEAARAAGLKESRAPCVHLSASFLGPPKAEPGIQETGRKRSCFDVGGRDAGLPGSRCARPGMMGVAANATASCDPSAGCPPAPRRRANGACRGASAA